jgi:hypothetical protein
VEAVPVWHQGLHQRRIHQLLKGCLSVGQLAVRHRSGHAHADLWHTKKAHQAEYPGGFGLELLVAQREARTHAQLPIASRPRR